MMAEKNWWEKLKGSDFGQLMAKVWPIIAGGAVGAAGGPWGVAAGIGAGSAASAAIDEFTTKLKAEKAAKEAGGTMPGDTSGGFKREPIYTPEQQALIDLLGPMGIEELLKEKDVSPIKDLLSKYLEANAQRTGGMNQQYQPQFYENLLRENLAQRPAPFNFEPFREKAMQNLRENIIPTIAERFTTMGKGAQSTGAFAGLQARAASDLQQGLSELEQQYNLKNRALSQKDQLMLQQLLGQQQNYGINLGELGYKGQALAQSLLGQEQAYDISRRGLGIDLLREGLRSPYEVAYQPGTRATTYTDALKQAIPSIVGGATDVLKAYIKNKGNPGQQQIPS